MAVIIDDASATIDMTNLVKDLKKSGLPTYARPCFVRLTKNIELTGNYGPLETYECRHCIAVLLFSFFTLLCLGTFKVKKTTFQDEGYDLNRVQEPIYYLNQQKQIYERLTADIYQRINNDKIRF
jgi:hypothetical protein